MLASTLVLSGCSLVDEIRAPAVAPLPAPPPPAAFAAPAPAASAAGISNPPVLLLGEVRDNAQAQADRFAELKRRVDAGWRPVIVMEQFDSDQQDLLDQAQKDCADPECVIRVMQRPGWNWAMYRSVIDLALTYQLRLVAGNLPRADVSRVVRDGFQTTFDAKMMTAYHLEAPPADLRAGQQTEIAKSHCNMLPEMMMAGTINAQMARDVWMAHIVMGQRPNDVVVLAENSRVRKDIGVPRWLAVIAPALTVRSEAYEEKDAGVRMGQYDVTHLVAVQKRPGACSGLKTKS
ncbi:MAG TPA: ChaN family lipoprotein [Janthinobacterium sp.]|nr:ChaN family lipoprotein [Janthinobacterium sp.]